MRYYPTINNERYEPDGMIGLRFSGKMRTFLYFHIMVWRILIVEDEEWAQRTLQEMLLQLYPAVELLFQSVATVKEAVKVLSSQDNIHLVFMDIHVADGNSFEIFEQVRVKVPVIFTTAYEQYALEAFRHHGYAYVLKPYDQDDLIDALNRVHPMLPQDTKIYKNRFLVKYGIRLKSLSIADIAYFMADDKLVYVRDNAGGQYILEDTLGNLIEKLDPTIFFQVNRKFIVRVESIVSMLKITRGRIKLELQPPVDIDVVVSQERSADFQSWLDK